MWRSDLHLLITIAGWHSRVNIWESGLVITQQQHPNALCANYLPHMPKGLPTIVQDLIPSQARVACVASSIPNGDVSTPHE